MVFIRGTTVVLRVVMGGVVSTYGAVATSSRLHRCGFILVGFASEMYRVVPGFASMRFIPHRSVLPTKLRHVSRMLTTNRYFDLGTEVDFFNRHDTILVLFPSVTGRRVHLFNVYHVRRTFSMVVFSVVITIRGTSMFTLTRSRSHIPYHK